jgi:putative DNA methylase
MVWDFAEPNIFADGAGDFGVSLENLVKALAHLPSGPAGLTQQLDASSTIDASGSPLISTDPPYYDNIGYADLSDFFYVWLRRSLRTIYPDLFRTVLVPKADELIATPYRFDGDKKKAERFFEEGLGRAFDSMRTAQDVRYPLTVYYAFKQAESEEGDAGGATASTGWETMLEGLLRAGFSITGTWPMRSELSNRMIASGTNALASSIVLVCRPRSTTAGLATRREFISALRSELPKALKALQHGNIAPVDLAQASIGPGMAIFSRYAKVLEADGRAMTVRAALQHINAALDEVLTEQESEYDPDTRWAIAWFEQFGMDEGPYGDAETLSRAKDTSVFGLVEAGILQARGGKVRLLRREEMPAAWNPNTDDRFTVWELTQHLIRRLDDSEEHAAELVRGAGSAAEVAHDLAYRLYSLCERKGWSAEALAYNSLGVAWPELITLAGQVGGPGQTPLFRE